MPPLDPVDEFFNTESLHLGGRRLIEFAARYPEHLLTLLRRFLETTSEADIYLMDAVSMLPPNQVIEAAAAAVKILGERAEWTSCYRVIESASAQFPEDFALWREAILDSVRLEMVDEQHGEPTILHCQLGPIWRGSPQRVLDRIETVVRDSSLSGGTRRTFAGLIFGSEDWTRIRKMVTDVPIANRRPLYFTESECLDNGFEFTPEGVRFLHGRQGYHLQFPGGYLQHYLQPCHPTFMLESGAEVYRFGGRSNGTCPNCGHPFAHLLTIDAALPDCGVTSVPQLELSACIHCRVGDQFTSYSADGRAIDFEVEGEVFDFPPDYFAATDVHLAPTPRRWIYPGTGVYENRYRLNGPPDWWQAAEFPSCRTCGKKMPLLLEIPSGARTEDGADDFMWGDGGAGYVYWCDGCRVSSLRGQCA